MKFESLHNHTVVSDGTQTHLDVLKTAESAGFGAMAFTDHDALPDQKILQQLKNYTGPVKWLVGIELSSGLPKELGGGATSMFHILGLFVDPTDRVLLDYCRAAQAGRRERMERIVANLQREGIVITVDDCLRAAGGESIVKPHIVAAVLSHPENLAVIERLRAQWEAAHQIKVDPDYLEADRRASLRGVEQWVYGLFLAENAFVPGVYVDYLHWVDMDASVKLIRDAGGVAVLAHWPTVMDKIDAALLEKFLAVKRLDGVELETGFRGPLVAPARKTLEGIAKRTGCVTTIGIDAHLESDIREFDSKTGLGEQTVGQTGALVQRFGPDLTWSNLA